MKMLALIFALVVLGLVGGHNREHASKPKVVCRESKPVPHLSTAIICETR
jgi:hypothetical protein